MRTTSQILSIIALSLALIFICGQAGCVQLTVTCNDTDITATLGERYVKGSVTVGASSSTDFCITDTQLLEYSCSGNALSTRIYDCENGCSDGACVSGEAAPAAQSLEAYPFPFIYNGIADVTIIYGEGSSNENSYILAVGLFTKDLASVLSEQTKTVPLFDVAMTDTEAAAQRPLTNLIIIGSPEVNRFAALMTGMSYPATKAEISSRLGYQEGEALLRLYSSPYNPSKVALLVSGWDGIGTKASAKALIEKTVDFGGKTEAILLTGAEEAQLTCTDSDSGKDYYVKGTVTDIDGNGTDYCSGANDLTEYFCGTQLQLNSETYTCPNGCQDGACVSSEIPEESCPEVSIIIYNYTCNITAYPKFITLNVQNRGFFNISGFMVKVNDKAENEEGGGIAGRLSLPCKEYSISPGQIKETVFQFPLTTIKQIEIEPFLGTCAKPALCDKAILRQSIFNC